MNMGGGHKHVVHNIDIFLIQNAGPMVAMGSAYWLRALVLESGRSWESDHSELVFCQMQTVRDPFSDDRYKDSIV